VLAREQERPKPEPAQLAAKWKTNDDESSGPLDHWIFYCVCCVARHDKPPNGKQSSRIPKEKAFQQPEIPSALHGADSDARAIG
jgi:hypothetical protein